MRPALPLLVAILALAPPLASQTPSVPPVPPAPISVETLAWMAGAWTAEGRLDIEEHWMAPKGGAMVGMGRTVARGRMVAFEFLRIETKDGGIDYIASPGGKPPTRFRLVRASATEAVFENLAHDFPKRILYRLQPDGSMLARVEGDGTEKEKALEFRYKRVR
jgi:hypothetical protein